jgi:CO/xanthine dehydrogenase Mo-binding subunit
VEEVLLATSTEKNVSLAQVAEVSVSKNLAADIEIYCVVTVVDCGLVLNPLVLKAKRKAQLPGAYRRHCAERFI